ncbi:hypothetical protein [Streptomyces sp. NPDC052042]|uniref:hypothetical protein n=1 Tax=Streptomyces sp. NPDC052042 TaxID=3365683 RepID=UPI0037D76D91
MPMTIKVYEVDRYGRTTRTVRPKAEVVPLKDPPDTDAYPACECDQCSTRREPSGRPMVAGAAR